MCLDGSEASENIVFEEGTCLDAFAGSRHGSVLACAVHGLEPVINLFQYPDNTLLATLQEGAELRFKHVALSARAARCVSLSDLPDRRLIVWDTATSRQIASATLADDVVAISFDPADHSTFCTVGRTAITTWEVVKQFGEYTLARTDHAVQAEGDTIECHVWDASHRVLCGTTQGAILAGSARRPDPLSTLTTTADGPVTSLVLTRQHVVAGTTGKIVWLDARLNYLRQFAIDLPYDDGRRAPVMFAGFFAHYGSVVAIDRAGRVCVGAIEGDVSKAVSPDDGTPMPNPPIVFQVVRRWNVSVGTPPAWRRAAFFPTGPHAAIWGSDNVLEIWDCQHQVPLVRVPTPSTITTLGVTHDARLLTAGFDVGVVGVYDVRRVMNTRLAFAEKLHRRPVVFAKFNASGTVLVTIATDGTCCIVRRSDLRVVATTRTKAPVLCATWIDDRDVVAVCSANGELHLLSLNATSPVVTGSSPSAVADLAANGNAVVRIATQFIGLSLTSITSSAGMLVGLCLDRSLKRFKVNTQGTWDEVDTVFGHELSGADGDGGVAVSPDGQLLASCARDGFVVVRHVVNPSKSTTLVAHDPARGGATTVSFSASSTMLVTAGADGGVLCFSVTDFSSSSSSEDATAPDMTVGPGLDTSFAADVDIASAFAQDAPVQLLGSAAASQAASMATAAALSSAEAASAGKIAKRLAALREEFQAIVAHNETCPEAERLPLDDLVADVRLQQDLERRGERRVRRVRRDIEKTNLRLQLLRHRIKQETWDAMEVRDMIVTAFQTSSRVRNFPIVSLPKDDDAIRQRFLFLRQMQIAERTFLADDADPTGGFRPERVTRHANFLFEVGASVDSAALGVTASEPTVPAAAGEKKTATTTTTTASNDAIVERVEFHPMALWSVQRKIMQVVLIRAQIDRVARAFNADVVALRDGRQAELEKLDEIRRTIDDVASELGVQDPLSATLAALLRTGTTNDADALLEVGDDEVHVPLVLSAAQLEAKRAADTERERAEAARRADDAPERALKDMMDGTLESKKGLSLLSDDIDRPAFMTAASEDKWTDEEKAMAAAYNEKRAARAVEREARRKQLEALLKKARTDAQDAIRAFDERVDRLAGRRLVVRRHVLMLELILIQLQNDLLGIERRRAHDVKFGADMDALQVRRQDVANAITTLRHNLDAIQRQHEQLHAEDRAAEKSFRKEFADAGPSVDLLFKWFRSRRGAFGNGPQQQRQPQQQQQQQVGESRDPFVGVDDRVRAEVGGADGDVHAWKPAELSVAVWDRFVEWRGQRLSREATMKSCMKDIEGIEERLESLESEAARLQVEMRDLREAVEASAQEHAIDMLNTKIMVKVKQGQVEIEEAPVLTDLRDCHLIDRGEVERQNERIVEMGTDKVGVLKDICEFRKGINLLLWQQKSYDLEVQEYQAQTAEFQALRVTKQLQEIIKAGGHETQHASETETLQNRTEFLTRIHKKKVNELRRECTRRRRKIKAQAEENERLAQSIDALQKAVQSRKDIVSIRNEGGDDGVRSKRMQALTTRRKLMDMVHAQAQEIDFLRKDLDAVRKRTFPSFAQAQRQQRRNRIG
ncbi:Cilia- and flagella-associated protein 43 [Plasmodiophora brassicae]|nr:hypothetical protein PBRA_003926 [Plasmodiophora brassicae]